MARSKALPEDHYRLSTYKRGSKRYVYGYRNVWDPVRRQSRSAKRFYVGVLNEVTRQVRLCQRFLANHPEYEGKVLYYENHELIEKRQAEAKLDEN